MKRFSKIIAIFTFFLCFTMMFSASAEAKRHPKYVKVTKVSVTSAGKATAYFNTRVKWNGESSVKVTDESNNEVAVTVSKKNKKSLVLISETLKNSGTYTMTITGIKSNTARHFGTVSKKFKVKTKQATIKLKRLKVNKKTITLLFNHKVAFKNDSTVTITDTNGNTIKSSIMKITANRIRVKAESNFDRQVSYIVTINGIKRANEGDEQYRTVAYSFYKK